MTELTDKSQYITDLIKGLESMHLKNLDLIVKTNLGLLRNVDSLLSDIDGIYPLNEATSTLLRIKSSIEKINAVVTANVMSIEQWH